MATKVSLQEESRVLLRSAFIGDVRGFKTNTPDELIIFAEKDPAYSVEDTSFFVFNPYTGLYTYLGTTGLGKDGGVQPFVLKRTNQVAALITETPMPGAPGATANLYWVILKNTLPPEITGGSGSDEKPLIKSLVGALIKALLPFA